jgi:glycerol-3-phosphate dehydrogenase (NAD(P)+)
MERQKIAIVGSGCWATALVKVILPRVTHLHWFIRDDEAIGHIKTHASNAKYLTYVQLETEKITFYSDITSVINDSDMIIFAVPSAFLHATLDNKNISFKNKFVVSAIKGLIPEGNLLISDYFKLNYGVASNNFAVISGPCHAEEVAAGKLSYLTIACRRTGKIKKIASKLQSDHIRTIVSKDVKGIEYASILKNIIAIASGICNGLGYGDNFQAVLISNAIREIKRFLDKSANTRRRQINSSVYLGDLLVTAYSQYSRNREFGNMIGKGYSIRAIKTEMNMIAEGYYASDCMQEVIKRYDIHMPISDSVYRILYNEERPDKVMQELIKQLH